MKRAVVCLDGCDGLTSFIRANGECLCPCGEPYWKHPYCKQSEYPGFLPDRPEYILHVLCDGLHTKH